MASALLFLLPLALLWVLFVRPQQRRMRQTQAMVATLDVGDEVVTSGGIYGTVTDTDGPDLWVEVAPDVVVRMLRGAIAQRVSPDDEEGEEEVDDAEDATDTPALDRAPGDDEA